MALDVSFAGRVATVDWSDSGWGAGYTYVVLKDSLGRGGKTVARDENTTTAVLGSYPPNVTVTFYADFWATDAQGLLFKSVTLSIVALTPGLAAWLATDFPTAPAGRTQSTPGPWPDDPGNPNDDGYDDSHHPGPRGGPEPEPPPDSAPPPDDSYNPTNGGGGGGGTGGGGSGTQTDLGTGSAAPTTEYPPWETEAERYKGRLYGVQAAWVGRYTDEVYQAIFNTIEAIYETQPGVSPPEDDLLDDGTAPVCEIYGQFMLAGQPMFLRMTGRNQSGVLGRYF